VRHARGLDEELDAVGGPGDADENVGVDVGLRQSFRFLFAEVCGILRALCVSPNSI
jgi:hypothetical protein